MYRLLSFRELTASPSSKDLQLMNIEGKNLNVSGVDMHFTLLLDQFLMTFVKSTFTALAFMFMIKPMVSLGLTVTEHFFFFSLLINFWGF